MAAWLGARDSASADLLSGDAVAQAVLCLPLPWSGTSTELLAALTTAVSEHTRTARGWPTSARGLSGHLKRLAPDLRRVGHDLHLPEGARNARERIITIRRGCNGQDTPDRQDRPTESLSNSPGSGCPVGCPVAGPGHQQDNQQDAESPNESGYLSGVSGVSGSTHHLTAMTGGRRVAI